MNKAVKIWDYRVKRIVGDIDEVIRRSGYKFEELKDGRAPRVSQARHRCFRDLNEMGFTISAIAELFKTSHSVVNYGINRSKKIEAWEKRQFVREDGT